MAGRRPSTGIVGGPPQGNHGARHGYVAPPRVLNRTPAFRVDATAVGPARQALGAAKRSDRAVRMAERALIRPSPGSFRKNGQLRRAASVEPDVRCTLRTQRVALTAVSASGVVPRSPGSIVRRFVPAWAAMSLPVRDVTELGAHGDVRSAVGKVPFRGVACQS